MRYPSLEGNASPRSHRLVSKNGGTSCRKPPFKTYSDFLTPLKSMHILTIPPACPLELKEDPLFMILHIFVVRYREIKVGMIWKISSCFLAFTEPEAAV